MINDGSYEIKSKKNVCFIIFNGKSIGSGSFQKYSEDVAILKYMYLKHENKEVLNTLYQQLYLQLEKDIYHQHFKKIITLVDDGEYDFYSNLGFLETDEYSMERIFEVLGAGFYNVKQMVKDINGLYQNNHEKLSIVLDKPYDGWSKLIINDYSYYMCNHSDIPMNILDTALFSLENKVPFVLCLDEDGSYVHLYSYKYHTYLIHEEDNQTLSTIDIDTISFISILVQAIKTNIKDWIKWMNNELSLEEIKNREMILENKIRKICTLLSLNKCSN
ncbi:MAG: hypothetical protein ACI4U3_09680 [Traorella sp.]